MTMLLPALCFLAFVKSDSASLVDLKSNNGREFYFGFMIPVGSFINPVVLVDTLNTSTRFSIDYPISRNISNVASNRTHAYMFVMEVSDFFPEHIFEYYTMNSKERNKGFHLTVNDSSSKSVSVKCFLHINTQPSSSYLALPYMELFVDEYEYYAISLSSVLGSNDWSALLIVGNRNDTELYITPTVNVSLPRDLQDPDSEEILIEAGKTFEATLHSMQTLLIRSTTNITGTRVVSNRPLSIISGHSVGTILGDDREPVSQQLLPTALWGNSFLFVPFVPQDIAQYFRVLASINETGFTYYCSNKQGSNVSNISAGEAYMFYVPPQVQCYLEAEKPVFITQYPDISGNTNEGDVTMITVASLNQYSNELVISPLRASDGSQLSHYVSISVPIEHFNEEQILYNDMPLDTEKWTPINDSNEIIVGYSYRFKFPTAESLETHYILRHSDPNGRLFAMVYGFASARAYGYPGGLAFEAENILGIKFSEDMYNVTEGDFILWLPVVRLRHYSQNISLAYFIEKFTENSRAVLKRGLLTLLPSDDQVNVSVLITQDKIVELTDMLRVRLYSTQEGFKDTYISTFINIVDDDTYTVGILELSYNEEMELFMITVGATDGELMFGDSVVLYLNATITYPNGSRLLLPLASNNQLTFMTYSSRFSLEFKISHWLSENETISNHSITCELFKSENKPEIILDPRTSRLPLSSAMHSTTTSQPTISSSTTSSSTTSSSTTSSSTTSGSTISSSKRQHYTALPNITGVSVVQVNITMISTVIIYATKIVTVAPNTTSRTMLPTSTADTSLFSSFIDTSDLLLPSIESIPLQSSVRYSPLQSPLFSDASSKATNTRHSIPLTTSRTISNTPIPGGSIGNESSSMMNLYLSIGIIVPCALILIILSGIICYFSGKRRQTKYITRDRANTAQPQLLDQSRVVLTGVSGGSTLESGATLPAAPEPSEPSVTQEEAQDSPAPSPVYDIAFRESTISTFKPETEDTQASPPTRSMELQPIQSDYDPIA